MNKQEIIDSVSKASDLPKAKAAVAIESFIDLIKSTLQKGDDFNITGFGKFSISERAATTGRNPRTGETIQIPASKRPTFKAGKELKDAVN